MTSEAHIQSGAQAVQDIAGAMTKAAGDCLTAHGPDPNAPAILTAAFAMAIDNITNHIDATFKTRLLLQIAKPFPPVRARRASAQHQGLEKRNDQSSEPE